MIIIIIITIIIILLLLLLIIIIIIIIIIIKIIIISLFSEGNSLRQHIDTKSCKQFNNGNLIFNEAFKQLWYV